LPPVLDVEVSDGVSSSTLMSRIAEWIDRIKTKTGLTPIIYTGSGFWDSLAARRLFPGVELWVAHWGVAAPRLPSGWSDWTVLHHSSHGTVPGIAGRVDPDVFHGTVADLKAYAASHRFVGAGAAAGRRVARPALHVGSRGGDVVVLQNDLKRHGF